ncbi:hypothetical protein AB0J90_10925 [Micromonospora sp. NPDC049523]|uniref:hypothetical protein n=1 Tax=Micromonospora sp. NPDC049523 TaxID=3155921 RepID=UPI0034380CB9
MSDTELSKGRPRQILSVPLPYAAAAVLLVAALVLAAPAPRTGTAEPPTVMVAEVGWPVAEQVAQRQQEAARVGADTLVVVVHLERAGHATITVPVQRGDTLDGLAKLWGVEPKTLVADNPKRFEKGKLVNPAAPISVRLTNPYQLPEGRLLFRSWEQGDPAPESAPATVTVFSTAGAKPIMDALSSTVVVLDSTGQVWAGPPGRPDTAAAWRWVLVVFLLILAVLCLAAGQPEVLRQADTYLPWLTRSRSAPSGRAPGPVAEVPSGATRRNPGRPSPSPFGRNGPPKGTFPPTSTLPAEAPSRPAILFPPDDAPLPAGVAAPVTGTPAPIGMPPAGSQPGSVRTASGYEELEQRSGPVPAEDTGTGARFDFSPWLDPRRGPESAAQCPRCFDFGLFRRDNEYRCDRCGEAGRVASGVWPGVVLGGVGTYGGSSRPGQ